MTDDERFDVVNRIRSEILRQGKTTKERAEAILAAIVPATRAAALEEAARVALRCAVSRDADCRQLQEHIAASIRAALTDDRNT